jgi:Lon protease-like protein
MGYELPLFPLNTVLFPGMPLTLHIFEERYKEMVNDCLANETPFGVVLIREGVEALGPAAQPHAIGCSAEIAQVQPLVGGRMNVLAVGLERFRIMSLHHDRAYLTGTVERFPLDGSMDSDMGATNAGKRLRPWVEQYLSLLSEAGEVEFDAGQLPDDSEALAYLAAMVIQIPNLQKQDLLATADTAELLRTMHDLYRRELPVLRLLLTEDVDVSGPGAFSLN